MSDLATPEATREFAAHHAELPGAYRDLDGLTVSTLGLGTYLGGDGTSDDELTRDAALTVLAGGVNLIDTAINYRAQRSERALGEALSRPGISRAQIVVCTKAGYLPQDGTVLRDPRALWQRTYLDSGVIPPGQIACGQHCLHPAYLRDQLGRSLRNLRLAAVDIFYLHNPETQLGEVARPAFLGRLRDAFALCESLCEEGLIGRYGLATWDGLRVPPEDPGHLSLREVLELGREVGGPGHHLRVVQLPLSLAMDEALFLPTQELTPGGRRAPLLLAAAELGVHVVGSAPLLQGRVLRRPLPARLCAPLPGLGRDSQRALQFARSAPGVTAVLCGLKAPAHVTEALGVLRVPPLSAEAFQAGFAAS